MNDFLSKQWVTAYGEGWSLAKALCLHLMPHAFFFFLKIALGPFLPFQSFNINPFLLLDFLLIFSFIFFLVPQFLIFFLIHFLSRSALSTGRCLLKFPVLVITQWQRICPVTVPPLQQVQCWVVTAPRQAFPHKTWFHKQRPGTLWLSYSHFILITTTLSISLSACLKSWC